MKEVFAIPPSPNSSAGSDRSLSAGSTRSMPAERKKSKGAFYRLRSLGHRRRSSSGKKPQLLRLQSFSLTDLGVLQAGYLEKLTSYSAPGKRRFLVLTASTLRWYSRYEGDDLLGEEKGVVALRDISSVKPVDECIFEVKTTNDWKRRAFRVNDRDERDMWIQAIGTASREKGGNAGGAIAANGRLAVSTTEHQDDVFAFCMDEEAPPIEMITVRDTLNHEVVAAQNVEYGKAVRLPKAMDREDVLVFRLGTGNLGSLKGDQLREHHRSGNMESPLKVSLSHGLGEILVKSKRAQGKEGRWYNDTEIVWAFIAVVIAVYGMNLLSLALVAYGAWSIWHAHQRRSTSIGMLEITVEKYQELTNKAALEAARKRREVPKKFIDGCSGDMVEARRRWSITREWRDQFDVDNILDKPHPHIDIIKRLWPHFFLPHDRDGDCVYIERTGQFNFPEMMAAGVTMDDCMHHLVHETEFLYKHLFRDPEKSKLVTVFDLAGAQLSDLRGDAKLLLKRALSFLQLHYPEKAKVVIVANAPVWFSIVWKIVRPLFNDLTANKIRIAASGKETYKTFAEFLSDEHIPVEYGGKLKYSEDPDSCRWQNPVERSYLDFTHAVNAKYPHIKQPPRVC